MLLKSRTHSGGRTGLTAAILALLAGLAVLLAPGLARADTASSLTVIGTSDVKDSGLMDNLIDPGFNAAYPQYKATYTGTATGKAINIAKSGNGGPSVLILHAASLENQFVAGGFSYGNQYGRALFTNDFVFAGGTADSAGIGAADPHDIANAYAKMADAGAAGQAVYYSRGGNSDAPGTTVEEHAIWELVADNHLTTSSNVAFCKVSAADGGGMTPITPATALDANRDCPDAGTVDGTTSGDKPTWYQLAPPSTSQASNVQNADACTGGPSGASCYVLTDRGTYDKLQAQGATAQLAIVTRDNSASALGGANALINYFHAYIVNPSAPNESVNLPGAQAFMSYITSPAVQAQIGQYLSDTTDPGGPPFKPDASPALSASALPGTVTGGQPVTVTGQVSNAQPGYAVPANQSVTVNRLAGGVPVPVASTKTNATGAYSLTFSPPADGSYTVSTGAIALIENATLNPAYGDILSPASTAQSSVSVNGVASLSRVTTSPRSVQLLGSVAPAAPDAAARIHVYARPQSSKGAFRLVGTQKPTPGQASYAVNGKLKGGKWTVEAQYSDAGALNTATTVTRNVTVPFRAVTASVKKVTVTRGKLRLTGKVDQAPQTKGATVRLYALSVGNVGKLLKKKTAHATKKPTKGKKKKLHLKQVAKVTIRTGHSTYTLTHKFALGHRYVLQLKYTHKGQRTTYSKYRYVTVR